MELGRLISPENLLAYFDLFRHYDDLTNAPVSLIPARQAVSDGELMPGRLSEPLHCTLADWAQRVAWSEEDRNAFAAYLASPEWQPTLAFWIKEVADFQRLLAETRPGPPRVAPTGGGPDADAMARFEEGKRKADEETRRLDALIPFRWEELPAHDYGLAALDIAPADRLMVGGVHCCIESIHQFAIYAGTLCGMPHNPAWDLHQVVRQAQRLHPNVKAKPFLAPPLLRKGNPHGKFPWVMLPPVAVVAQVKSDMRVAVLIWFQDRFEQRASDAVLSALAAMDWDAHSEEWDP